MSVTETRAEADFVRALATLVRDRAAVDAARGFGAGGPAAAAAVRDALPDLFAETALERLLEEERRNAEVSVTAAQAGEEAGTRDLFGRRLAESAAAVAGRCYEGAAHAAGEAAGGTYEEREAVAELVRRTAGILLADLRVGIAADVLAAERGRYLNRWRLAEAAGRPRPIVEAVASPSTGLHKSCRYRTPVPRGDRDELRRRLMEQAESDPSFTVPTEDGGEFSQRRWGELVGGSDRTVGKDEFYKMIQAKVRPARPLRPKRAGVDSATAAVTRAEDDPLAQMIAGEEAERTRKIACLEAEQKRDIAAERAGRAEPV